MIFITKSVSTAIHFVLPFSWLQPYLSEEMSVCLDDVLKKQAEVSLQYTKYNWLLNKL